MACFPRALDFLNWPSAIAILPTRFAEYDLAILHRETNGLHVIDERKSNNRPSCRLGDCL